MGRRPAFLGIGRADGSGWTDFGAVLAPDAGAPVHIDKQDIVSGAGLWRFGTVGDFSIFLMQCSPSLLMYDECTHGI